MPKQEHILAGFHGGINNNSDPKDIQPHDLREADGVSVHKLGRIIGIGAKGSALSGFSNQSIDIEPGYGLHYFSTDYDSSSNNNPEDYLAMYNKTNNKVKFYYRDKNNNGSSPGFLSDEVTFGSAIKPNYYYAEGMLRIGDANLSQDSKWFGYIDSSLYWTNSQGNSANIHDIKKFDNGNQKFQDLNQLTSGDLKLIDITSSNPAAGTIGTVSNKVWLGYILDDGGDWNGNYVFGATVVYKENQEGPITTIYDNYVNKTEKVLSLYNNRLSFQVYLSMGESNTISSSTNHIIGSENRMIGINWYFKEQGEDEWIFLNHTDLQQGGKHFWKVYNSSAETSYGIWAGDTTAQGGFNVRTEGISIWNNETTPNSAISFHDKSDGSGTAWMTDGANSTFDSNDTYNTDTQGYSYKQVYLRVKLDNNNSTTGFDNRYGFLRVWGGASSPLYVSSVNNSLIPLKTGGGSPGGADDTYYVPMTLPSAGTDKEFRVQVLDENFNVIADSGIYRMTIADSGATVPDDYEQQVEI